MKIGVVIPTLGDRPAFLEFCLERLKKQTRKADHVALVNYQNTSGLVDISQRYKKGISYLIGKGCDLILFIEDDDYYPLTYIEETFNLWVKYGKPDIMGCKETVYYHMPTSNYLTIVQKHCSAYCTSISSKANFDVCEDNGNYFDVKLWSNNRGVKVEYKRKPIGIKHGIGRCGGKGHESNFYKSKDIGYNFLKENIDSDAFSFYSKMFDFQKPIKVFYHICMMNNYLEVVKEQMELMVKSGLYDKAESISIGCNGSNKNGLINVLSNYSKAEIKAYERDLKSFEFVTLRLIEQESGDYHGLYFHTKGVTYPNHIGGKVWREYMNYYNILEWKKSVEKLKTHDTCGVKFLNKEQKPAFTPHYSGNFFWFNSDYVKKLPKIDSLNKTDRYQAEFWIGKADPKAASLCQKFINYASKEFKPEKTNVYVHTLAYNLPEIVEKSVKDLHSKNKNIEHYVVNLDFPLETDAIPKNIEASKRNCRQRLINLANNSGSNFLDFKNIGVSQNWQTFIDYIMPNDEDIIIGADPDEQVLQSNWVNAMRKVFEGDSKIALVSLVQDLGYERISKMPKKEAIVNGVRVWYMEGLTNWALIGFKGEFLNKIKKIPYPAKAERYGWIEHETYPLIKSLGYKWVILPDFKIHHLDYPEDKSTSKLYRGWKNQIVHRINEFGQISFEEYLEKLKTNQIKCEY